MMRQLLAFALIAACGTAAAQSQNCANVPRSLPANTDLLAPVAPELSAINSQLGTPAGVLAQAYGDAVSVDAVITRIRIENCKSVSSAIPAPSAANSNDPAAYKKRSEFDNGPWRFDMTQGGKRMTADEFDAWMKSRGVRVARGATPVAPSTAQPSAPAGTADTAPAKNPAPKKK
jgi:hypothetical protein